MFSSVFWDIRVKYFGFSFSFMRIWRKHHNTNRNRDFSYPDRILVAIQHFQTKSGQSRRTFVNRDGWTVWNSKTCKLTSRAQNLGDSTLHCLRYLGSSSHSLLPSPSVELSSLGMHSVPRVKSYLTFSFGKPQKGGNPSLIPWYHLKRHRNKVDDLPSAMGNKNCLVSNCARHHRPWPQDDDDDLPVSSTYMESNLLVLAAIMGIVSILKLSDTV